MLEVHLAGRAGPFQHHRVELGGQARRSTAYAAANALGLKRDVLAHAHVAHRLAANDHLAAGVGIGLEQDRIHAHVGLDAAGLRLHDLGPAHFAAVAGDERIERHVLRLERRHAQAVLEENAAQRRRQHALARVGTCALEHQGRRSLSFPPVRAVLMARRGSSFDEVHSGPSPSATAANAMRQGIAKPLVFCRRPHGEAKESLVQVLRRVEGANGDALPQQSLGQGRRGQVAPIQPRQEKIRRARIDVQPRQLPHSLDQLPPLGGQRRRPSAGRSRCRPTRPRPPLGPACRPTRASVAGESARPRSARPRQTPAADRAIA